MWGACDKRLARLPLGVCFAITCRMRVAGIALQCPRTRLMGEVALLAKAMALPLSLRSEGGEDLRVASVWTVNGWRQGVERPATDAQRR